MISIAIKPRVKKFIKVLPPKHQRQVKDSIIELQKEPIPHDSKQLVGYNPYLRIDIGEYRIIYKFDSKKKLITVVLIGRRNDSAVYKGFKRIYKKRN